MWARLSCPFLKRSNKMIRNLLTMLIASILIFLSWTFLKIEIVSIFGFITAVVSYVIVDFVLGKTMYKEDMAKEEKIEDNKEL